MNRFWTTAEMLVRGHSHREIRRAVEQAALQPVRKGHFASPGTDESLLRAVRVGGIATATTASRATGIRTPPDPVGGPGAAFRRRVDRLHVALPRNAARLRDPDDASLPFTAREDVVLHWVEQSALAGTERTRLASPLLLVQHAFLTLPPERALAVLDSAVHLRHLRSSDLAALKAVLPVRLHAVVDAHDRAESGTETIARHLLRRLGLQVEVLQPIGGLGTVDLLVEGRLIVELDSHEFHTDDDAFENDRRRDLAAATGRCRTMRFTWYQVLFRWNHVETAVLAALAA